MSENQDFKLTKNPIFKLNSIKIKYKLLFGFALLIAFLVISSLVIWPRMLSQSMEQEIRNRSNDILSVITNQIEDNKRDILMYSDVMSYSRDVRDLMAWYSNDEIQPKIATLLKILADQTNRTGAPFTLEIIPQRGYLPDAETIRTGFMQSVDKEFVRKIQRLIANESNIVKNMSSNVQVQKNDGGLAIVSTSRIFKRTSDTGRVEIVHGKYSGIAAAVYPLDNNFVSALQEKISEDIHLKIYMLNNKQSAICIGSTVTNQDGEPMTGEKLSSGVLSNIISASAKDTIYADNNKIEGKPYRTAYRVLTGERGPVGVLAVSIPTEKIIKAAARTKKQILLIASLGVILALAVIWWITKSINTPLGHLIRGTEQVAKGDFSTRISIHANDELGFLASRFNWMTENIDKQRQELYRLNQLKDEFLANTSHELRTPLNGIIGIAESLIDGATGKLSKKTVSNLVMIATSGKRLASLVNDILDFSKLKNRDIVLQRKLVDVRQVVQIVLDVTRLSTAGKPIKLENQVGEDIGCVYADVNRLQQILYNLIGNAVKFTPEGTVSILASKVGNMLELTVRDTGIGVPKDKSEAIFKYFEQVDAATSREYGGTGLGLSITKHIVELHGGKIWVESEPAKGSDFKFTIPLSSSEVETQKDLSDLTLSNEKTASYIHEIVATTEIYSQGDTQQDEMKLQNSGDENVYKVLVADDEPINLQVLTNHLTLQNWEVQTALNGQEALDIIENGGNFDLVILDVMMPKISGYEVCRAIRKKYSLVDLPVLMLTAKDRTKDIIAGLEVGANDYLVKPFDKRELFARTKTLLTLKNAVERAVSNAQSFESERKQRKLAENLRAVLNSLSSTLELNEVFNLLLDNLSQIINYDRVVVMLKNDEKYEIKALRGYSEAIKAKLQHSLDGLDNFFQEALQSKQPSVIKNLYTGEYSSVPKLLKNAGSLIGVPLVSKNEVTGMLILQNKNADSYTDYEAEIAFTFAAQAAIAIENAKLFGEVKLLATTDGLTGLYNRRYFFELSEYIYATAKALDMPISVIMLDVDYFKKFNDNYGHETGDKVLKLVAGRCKEILGDIGLIGRYGGEEFSVFMQGIGLYEATQIAERLRKGVEDETLGTEKYGELSVTISLGVAEISYDNDDTLAMIFNRADDALYEAKRQGRNKVVKKA